MWCQHVVLITTIIYFIHHWLLCCNVCSEQTHVTCSKSPVTVAATISAQSPFMIASSAATSEVHTTVGNLLSQTLDTILSSIPGSTAASLGIGLAEFGICFAVSYQYSLVLLRCWFIITKGIRPVENLSQHFLRDSHSRSIFINMLCSFDNILQIVFCFVFFKQTLMSHQSSLIVKLFVHNLDHGLNFRYRLLE